MAFNSILSQKLREHIAKATDDLETIFDAGQLSIYPGTQPANADATEVETALVNITLPADAFGVFAADRVPKAGVWSATASAPGTATWYRLYAKDQSGGTAILTGPDTSFVSARADGSVGAAAGFDLILGSAVITSGQTITISTFDLVFISPVTI